MKHKGLSFGIFLLALAFGRSAQTQDTANKDSTGAKPTSPADKTAPKQDTQATPEKKKPKKVWTNDEVANLSGKVSVVGQANQAVEPRRRAGYDSSSDEGNGQDSQIDNYRQQIGEIHNQIDAADQRIAQLKNFKGENNSPTGGINPNKGYNMVPVGDQIKQLEAKKKKLQGQIDDLENEARKNGIDPGKLR
jgi:chromosome segregation ATPase